MCNVSSWFCVGLKKKAVKDIIGTAGKNECEALIMLHFLTVTFVFKLHKRMMFSISRNI